MKERKISQLALHVGSCVDLLKLYPDNHFDSVVTDPPYDLTANKKGGSGEASVNLDSPYGRARITTGFMGQKWDGTGIAFKPSTWAEVLRVLKPGGHVLAFGGTRTYHRMVCAIEDAGFEMRDMIAWLYGQGFPKALDASKTLDAHHGIEREVTREATVELRSGDVIGFDQRASTERERRDLPVSDDAKKWDGWGTALKPAIEPICVGRKPLIGTVAENIIAHGTGALNIDGCRISISEADAERIANMGGFGKAGFQDDSAHTTMHSPRTAPDASNGRWPANVVHDGSDAVLADFPDAPGQLAPISYGTERRKTAGVYGEMSRGNPNGAEMYEDQGSAARFFYCAKASMQDRDEGLDSFDVVRRTDGRSTEHEVPNLRTSARRNFHPTVKPVDLMRWLVRLVTPPGGKVLDPFMGSGSTGKGCMLEGFRFVGMDLTPEYEPIARARILWALKEKYNRDPFGFGGV